MRRILSLAVVSIVAAVGVSAAAAAGPPTVSITATKTSTGYNTKALTAPAGTQFLLVFKNLSTKQHNVSLELGELEYGATLTIGKATTATIFTLKKGVYHFYSSVGKDETAGMSGTLTVK